MSTPLSRLVTRVRRRLFLQTFGSRLVVLGSVALLMVALGILLVAGVRFRASPWALDNPLFLTRLAWFGGAVALAVCLAWILAWLRRPSPLAAALSIDQTFKLHERISTSLALSPEQASSPAGQALQADTARCLEKLAIAPAYPLKPARRAALLPLGFILCLAAIFFCDRQPIKASPETAPVSPALKAELSEVKKGLKELAKQTPPPQKNDKLPKGEDMQKFGEELERLAQKEPKTNEEAKDLFKDLSSLEEKMRRHEKALADRTEALKQQSEEADRLSKKQKKDNLPPHEKAMNDGDFQKAANELQRLSRELQDDKLSPEERAEMEKDMQDLREKLDRIAEAKQKRAKDLNKEREKKEKEKKDRKNQKDRKDKQEGGDPQEGEGDEGDEQDLQDLEEMSEEEMKDSEELREAMKDLEEMEKAEKEGDKSKAAQKLKDAAAKLAKCDKGSEQGKASKALAQLQALKQRLGRQMGQGSNPASGKRPDKPEEDIQGTDIRSRTDRTEGGVSGFRFVPGQGLREPKKDEEVRPLIEGAGREAAEALQRQRVPRADADLTRGYFEKLRKSDGDKK